MVYARRTMQVSVSAAFLDSAERHAEQRCYRLIDGRCEPHGQLDGQYGSVDDALADAITWIGQLGDAEHPANLIGVEVCSGNGDWRTCRLPAQLLCLLPE
jgi:hypothetical protein